MGEAGYSLTDLPPELMRQLRKQRGTGRSDIDTVILSLVRNETSLDMILIGLYRSTGTIFTRKYITGKCYRLVKAGLLVAVPNRYGIYAPSP